MEKDKTWFQNIIKIYNFVFPDYINELKLWDYTFRRAQNYKEAFNGMMHLYNSSWSEFSTEIKTGSHQITAYVDLPKKEKKCKLEWQNKKATQLDDILLILSLLNGVSIFKEEPSKWPILAIIEDHRHNHFGWQLGLSITVDERWQNKYTGETKTREQIQGMPIFDYNHINIGFEKGVNDLLKKISSSEWQKEYEGWYFIFLFRSAMQLQTLESSFISCWTIWEHIFAIKNREWLDDVWIEQMSADKKISFILKTYFLRKIDEDVRKNIKRITKTRNRLIHFWRKTDHVDYKEIETFIRLTEQLMAIILWLSPSNCFNSFEEFEKMLKKK